MSNYTPTTEEVREFFADSLYVWRTGLDAPLEAGDAFDLWLASVKAEAWDEGQQDQLDTQEYAIPRGVTIPLAPNPHRKETE